MMHIYHNITVHTAEENQCVNMHIKYVHVNCDFMAENECFQIKHVIIFIFIILLKT